MGSLPSFAPFPPSSVITRLDHAHWQGCIASWDTLAVAYLSIPEPELAQLYSKDTSVIDFLVTFMKEVAADPAILGSTEDAARLIRNSFLLSSRLLSLTKVPASLLQWSFLADLCRLDVDDEANPLMQVVFQAQASAVEVSLGNLKKFLIKNLDDGLEGDLSTVEENLNRLNHLLRYSPDAAAFFLAGSDFVDGLINCYKIMNPPLRKSIITTTYLCVMGLTEGPTPKFSMLTDQLYSLKVAAEQHKAGPLNVNDSMVAELVTSTPILAQIEKKLSAANATNARTKDVITALGSFKKPGGMIRPKRAAKRKDKGKGIALADLEDVDREMHFHRTSQISSIQDLFPDMGDGFISRLLDAFGDDTETVIASLLEDSLPDHLVDADRSEKLADRKPVKHDIAPRSTPPQLESRHNQLDNDDLNRLDMDMSKLNFGKQSSGKTADDLLADRSTASRKAAILAALAAFDSDDDERDDTYDAGDVGGFIDAENADDIAESKEKNDEILFGALNSDPRVFTRDQATRSSVARSKLRQETGMTDEMIEGWALMMERNPQIRKRMETRFSVFNGAQTELAPSHWTASAVDEGELEDSGPANRGGRGRGRGRVRGRGGNVAGHAGDKDTIGARRDKEAHKGSRANHNRRNQRAKKMARGGLPG